MGYLYAIGDVRRVLILGVTAALAWAAVAAPLLPALGAAAMGWGWVASSVVQDAFIVTVLRGAGVSVIRATGVPIVVAALAGMAGWLVASSAPPTAITAVLTAVGPLALYLLGLLACHPRPLRDAMATGARAVRFAAR
jgi:hypothetical protein